MPKRTIVLNDGKYTVEHVDAPDYSFKALRHGEEWRDLCGDGLVLAMFEAYQDSEERRDMLAAELETAVHRAQVLEQVIRDAIECYSADGNRDIKSGVE